MSKIFRFGKNLPVPSTVQIKHELRLMAASNDLVEAGFFSDQRPPSTDASLYVLAGELSRKHGLSVDRAQMLVDRFEGNRHTLSVAAHELSTARVPVSISPHVAR